MRAWQTKIDNTAPTDPGILSAAEDNARGQELPNVVSTSGITPDAYNAETDTDLYMLAQAIARYASGGIFAQDGGAANTYVLTTPLAFIMPKAYFKGMMVEFYPANANTGASTVNAFSLGAKKILSPAGVALTGNELLAGQLTALVYDPALDSAAGAFKIKPWAAASTVAETANFTNLPFFPDVEEADGKLTVSNLGGGSLQIAAGQSFVWRGWQRIQTDDFSAGDRTVTTLANKEYHVRWHAPGTGDASPASTYPNGRFRLKDVSDAGYNPSTLDETDTAFDTTYDDMLVARIVTDGSNVATLTTLRNNDRMFTQVVKASNTLHSTSGAAYAANTVQTINWARTPQVAFERAFVGATGHDMIAGFIVEDITRYTFKPVVTGYNVSGATSGSPINAVTNRYHSGDYIVNCTA